MPKLIVNYRLFFIVYKCLKSQRKTDSQIKEKMEEFDEDLKNAFEIGAELNKNR